MGSYFPSAKHSRVILDASMAVVSGNFTLMSAGYFLSPEPRNVPLQLQKTLFPIHLHVVPHVDLHQVRGG